MWVHRVVVCCVVYTELKNSWIMLLHYKLSFFSFLDKFVASDFDIDNDNKNLVNLHRRSAKWWRDEMNEVNCFWSENGSHSKNQVSVTNFSDVICSSNLTVSAMVGLLDGSGSRHINAMLNTWFISLVGQQSKLLSRTSSSLFCWTTAFTCPNKKNRRKWN